MNLSALKGQNNSKIFLLVIVGLLVFLNIARSGYNYYLEESKELEDKKELLLRYREQAKKLSTIKKKVARLNVQKNTIDNLLFSGVTEEEIASSMQVMLQELVTNAGLQPQSVRPIRKNSKGKEEKYGKLKIKMRITGSFNDFIQFLADLYRSQYLFKIENFTIKPHKGKLKVFLEFQGYYRLGI
jgi:Tfp pilus assembly protein PilO